MSTDISIPETILLRRLYTSTVVHAIDTLAPKHPDDDSERPRALCSLKPFWPGVWLVTEFESSLMCRNCESALEASQSVGFA